jgi:hypothetical protein
MLLLLKGITERRCCHNYLQVCVRQVGFVRANEVCRGLVSALEASQKQPPVVKLTPRQISIAIKASMFLVACAKVGLDALVDEATGYQAFRDSDALQVKLRGVS